jgi:hypothetical protein
LRAKLAADIVIRQPGAEVGPPDAILELDRA